MFRLSYIYGGSHKVEDFKSMEILEDFINDLNPSDNPFLLEVLSIDKI